MSNQTIRITVNGEPKEVQEACTVAQLIELLELTGKRIAVERNLEIVPRTEHAQTALQDNDVLEIVQAIGGG